MVKIEAESMMTTQTGDILSEVRTRASRLYTTLFRARFLATVAGSFLTLTSSLSTERFLQELGLRAGVVLKQLSCVRIEMTGTGQDQELLGLESASIRFQSEIGWCQDITLPDYH